MEQTIKENGLIMPDDRVLCAISGGADSVVLLHCLHSLRQKLGFTLYAAHFNHCMRPVASDEDEQFVLQFCGTLGVECYFGRADVYGFAKEKGYTPEQAGRILRYEFLENLGFDKIAVAHHMDDQAESIMLHITRGSGTAGLCGMRYMRGNIIRPLLDVRRNEIEAYAYTAGLSYCTDATNFLEDGTRNKLRLSVIPQITEKINPSFTESLCSMANIVRKDEDYMCDIAMRELEAAKKDDGFLRENIASLPEPIRRRALRIAMQRAGAYADIELRHVELVEHLLFGRTGAVIFLPHIVAFNSYEKICFSSREKYAKITTVDEYCMPFSPGLIKTPYGVMKVEKIHGNKFVSDKFTAYMDADKVPPDSVIRSRKSGDMLHPVGSTGRKKLKDFFIDKKVERHKRNLPLICSGSNVLCIVGMAVSKQVMVSESTTAMIKITFKSEEQDE
ncbi:MAG: tRNA lysidine(34) synthetase TilS [Clostridia bacterium]|nr:tRNA lysidine(34) synthetase TilS [Clostridia bacterium]